MTTLDLRDPSSGDEWRLYNVQLGEDDTQADPDVFPQPGFDSGETFVTVLTERERFQLTGLVTAPRLSSVATPNAYSSDWFSALAEYVGRGEGFAHSSQGSGYTLEDRSRSRTSLNVVIEQFQWTLERGAVNQLSYQLTLRRGEGVLPDGGITVTSPTPGAQTSQPTLGGETLHGFRRLECTKSMGGMSQANIAFSGTPADNQIWADEGMTRRWTLDGRYPSGKTPDQDAFDDNVRGLITNQTHTFSTVFPGYSPDVKVIGFDAPRSWQEGGESHEYTIRMIEAST
jgi:hypothetical protein